MSHQYSFIFSHTFILFGVLHSFSHFRCFHLGIFSFYWKIPFYVPFSASLLMTESLNFLVCLFENCIYSAFIFEGYILLGNQYWVDNCFLSSLWRCFFIVFWLPLILLRSLIFLSDNVFFSLTAFKFSYFLFGFQKLFYDAPTCGFLFIYSAEVSQNLSSLWVDIFQSFWKFFKCYGFRYCFCPITLSSSYGILITHIFDTHLMCSYLWYLHVLFFLHFNFYFSMTYFQVH